MADIIIDNTDPGFQLAGSGYWYTRNNPPWPSYGNDFRFNESGYGTDQAVYTFDIPASGDYEVYAWWPSNSICSENTPYIIPFSDGTVTIRVNQQQNPGQWNLLATGFFEEGEYQIIISDDVSSGMVVADAIRIAPEQSANNAPILDPIGNMSVNEGELLEFTVTASDPDGDGLTYSASNLPEGATFDATFDPDTQVFSWMPDYDPYSAGNLSEGATFDPDTQVFSWMPDYDQSGNYAVLFTVTDDGDPILSDSEEITITVGAVNRPPVLDPIGDKTISEMELLEFTVTASDPDGDGLTYSASNLPEGATFDPDTQVFSWMPDYDQSGNYAVLFTVTDDGDALLSDSEEITITIGAVNHPPILDLIGNRTVNEGELLEFIVSGNDPDGDDVTYSASNLPEGATFDQETQIFSWTPDWQSSGEHKDIVFSVSDGTDYDEEIITIDVIDISPLEAPTGLKAFQNGTTITLYWDSVINDELGGYNIYRSTSDPGNYMTLNALPVTDTQYTDTDVEQGITYYYFVTAVDIFDNSELLSEGLNSPFGLAFNDEGRLFVSTWDDGTILNIDNDGSWFIYASGLGTPYNLAFRNSNLFVTNYDGGPVNMITPEGDVYPYGESLELQNPTGLAFNPEGELFVAEDENGRIYKISSDGETWELFVEGLDGPASMAFDDSGNLFVGEDLWVGGEFVGAIDIFYPDGTMDVFANLTDPDGICFDKSDNLYVGRSEAGQVTKIMPDGNSMPIIQDIVPWDCGINKFGELIVSLTWDGQIIKVHLSHVSDISNIVSITLASNNAPILDPIGNMSVDEDQLLEFTITATDPDGDSLTFSASNLPEGATFDPETQTFSWTPDYGQAGTYTNVLFMVSDDGDPVLSDSEEITITVEDVNRPPVLDPIGNRNVNEDDTLTFTLSATDPDGDSLTFSASNLPEGATFDSVAQTFSWTPDYGQAGTYTNVFFMVSDDGDSVLSDSEEITITVEDVNRPPELDPIGNRDVNEGDTLTFALSATDPDGDSLTFSASNLPEGAAFDPETQVFSWTSDYGQSGNYAVLFTVTDDGVPPASDSREITITVGDINRPPVLNPIGNKTVEEGKLLEFTITASDPDGNSLTFSAADLPTGADFDPAAQTFSWTPDYGQAGTYTNAFFMVSDDGDPVLSDSEEITITVEDVNRPPELDPIGNRDVNEGELLEFTITASDPDGGSLTFSAGNLPTGADFDPATQTFSWTPDYGQAGTYTNVLFMVSDDGDPVLSDSEEITITVEDVNRPPELDPIGNRDVNEGDTLTFTLSATDPDGDSLTFSASNLPDGATFDSVAQTFSWTPDYGQAGTYPNVQFMVSDDGDPQLSDSEQIEITVGDDANIILDNTDPGFQLTGSGNWETVYNPPWPCYGNDTRYNVAGDGEDQAIYTFEIPTSGYYEVYAWWASDSACSQDTPYTISFSDGTVTIRVNQQQNPGQWNLLATGFFEEGEHQVIISDDASGTIVVADGIMIGDLNNAPVLNPIGNKTIDELELLEFTVTATDPDNDDLTYSAGNLPVGATFDPETQVFSWTPDYGQSGNYAVLFTVTDDGVPPASDSREITITVGDINRPPVLNPIGNKTVEEGKLLEFTITALDPDGNSLTFSAADLPTGAEFDPATQTFSWTPDYGQASTYTNVLFMVSDDGDPQLSDSEQIEITVQSSSAPVDIIIDNTDPGFQLTGSGNWETVHNPPWPCYGNDTRYNMAGDGEDQAIYTFEIPTSGYYEVYAWWASDSACSQDTPYTISFSDGTVTIRVNQQQTSGQWNLLAAGFFEEGEHQVIISDDASGTIVVADAVRIISVQ